MRLTELKSVAEVLLPGGLGVKDVDTLARASGKGSRAAKQLQSLGNFYNDKFTTKGRIELEHEISIRQIGRTKNFTEGTYVTLSGTINNRTLYGIGGEAPPSGAYLTLDKPIRVGSLTVTEIFVGGEHKTGEKAGLHGRLDIASFGGVEVRNGRYVKLSGISNILANEPMYDGQKFLGAGGWPALSMQFTRPHVMDAPNILVVVDRDQNKAFIGGFGGFLPPQANRFHGFSRNTELKAPTEADRKAVKSRGDQMAVLFQSQDGPTIADGMQSKWLLDREANKIYLVQSGGLAGFVNFVRSVIQL